MGRARLAWALLILSLPSAAAEVTHRVDLRVAKLECSQVPEARIRVLLGEASRLLVNQCGLRIRYRGFETLPTLQEWCLLPSKKKKRVKAVQTFTLPFRAGWRSHEISLFLVDRSVDHRMAWAHFDQRRGVGCGFPRDPADFQLLGSVFMTNDAFDSTQAQDQAMLEPPVISTAALILTHELVHAMTQQGHPTGQKPGNIMADVTGDIGPNITREQCECLLESPWARIINKDP